jgi:ribosomal protection tetracycline resistance protein
LPQKNIRNIALFAHVDAGKTSLTEQFLYLSGKIKKLGSVDKGNSQTDNLEVERERGITVNSSVLSFEWKQSQINLIDTPGHIDFSSESENAILAIDAAVVVLSAVEGVQAQTEHLVSLLKKHQKPFLFFINKIDREGADVEQVLLDIKQELELSTIDLNAPVNTGSSDAFSQELWNPELFHLQTQIIETVVEFDDALFDSYLNGEVLKFSSLDMVLRNAIYKAEIYPVLYGSAKLALGIEFVLDAILDYLPRPTIIGNELQGIVFKTYHLKGEGKVSAIRLFSGELKSRANLWNASKSLEDKISLIKNTDLQNTEVIGSFSAGEMAWVQGLKSVEPGDFIGKFNEDLCLKIDKTPALLTVQVIPEN